MNSKSNSRWLSFHFSSLFSGYGWLKIIGCVLAVIIGCAGVLNSVLAATTPIFQGSSPPVYQSTASLVLNDNLPTDKTFQWSSNDSILGAIDTGLITANLWNYYPGTGTSPPRLIFGGTSNGTSLTGDILFGDYKRAVVDVATDGGTVAGQQVLGELIVELTQRGLEKK